MKDINQVHFGSGDNVAGDKIIINKQSDRTIKLIKNQLVDKLKEYPQKYKIFLSSGDSEMEYLAIEIDQAFQEARWENIGFIYKLARFYPAGITFEVKDVDVVSQTIADMFHRSGLKVRGNKNSNVEQFSIIIGPNK